MRVGLIAKKLGMTRFFREAGSNVPVTLIGIEKNYVTRVKEDTSKRSKQTLRFSKMRFCKRLWSR